MRTFDDLTHKRFGQLVVLSQAGRNKYGHLVWLCQCDCGNRKIVDGQHLRHGNTRSCGCMESLNRKNFGTRSIRTHEASETPLYKAWMRMKVRCNNQNSDHWNDYGGRGISVCAEWNHSFEAFQKWALENGWRQDLTLDRIDVNGNYEPSNCRWITNAEQQCNKRNNRWYTFNGKTQLIPAWAKEFGVTDSMIRSRIQKGANPVEVLRMYHERSMECAV